MYVVVVVIAEPDLFTSFRTSTTCFNIENENKAEAYNTYFGDEFQDKHLIHFFCPQLDTNP